MKAHISICRQEVKRANWKQVRLFKSQSLPPPSSMSLHYLTAPKSATAWGPSIQTPEPYRRVSPEPPQWFCLFVLRSGLPVSPRLPGDLLYRLRHQAQGATLPPLPGEAALMWVYCKFGGRGS